MEHRLEKSVDLAKVSVQLATVNWQGIEDAPPYPGYNLSQRLSDDHPPLRLGNLKAPEILPRVRSVGFLPPGRAIRLFPVEKPLRVLYCIYDKDNFETITGIPQEIWDQHLGELVAIRNKRLEILMQEIHAELLQPGFCHELLIEGATAMMAAELARHLTRLERKKSRHGDSLALAPWQLRRIEERIQASPELGYPNLSDLAEICGLSQGHLMRAFKASTGWQIHKYIAEQRLESAKTLLAEERYTCEEVAVKLGFKTPAYFSTAFRRMTGKTPTEFRRQVLVGG